MNGQSTGQHSAAEHSCRVAMVVLVALLPLSLLAARTQSKDGLPVGVMTC